MAGEKYVLATMENPFQIQLRNMLNPNGFVFLGNCGDPISLLRLIRSYQPDFIVVDTSLNLRELRIVIETLNDEMLCACIIIGEYKNMEIENIVEGSNVASFVLKPVSLDILLNTLEMALLNYKRVSELSRKLKEMTENFETRKLVEMAKAILIKRDGLSECEAYGKIRARSMDSRMPMKEIAEAIITLDEMKKGR